MCIRDSYQYVFVHSDTGIRAKEIVYFSDDNTYIYGYRAAKDDFEDNDKDMTVYLPVSYTHLDVYKRQLQR